MEPDFHIEVKGLQDEVGKNTIIDMVDLVIKALSEGLDLRRMHRVIVAMDYAGELKILSTELGQSVSHTKTEPTHSQGVALVMRIPRGDGIEILPVVNGKLFIAKANDEEGMRILLGTLHYEFCHVHDYNKQIDAFPGHIQNPGYSGKDAIIRPMAEYCWSEYIATMLSSSTVPKSFIFSRAEDFKKLLEIPTFALDKEIAQFLYAHRDVSKLMLAFDRHMKPLISAAAHMIGYMKGLQKSLVKLGPEAAQKISGSYFEPIWNGMCKSLAQMHRLYPDNWKDLSIYDDLSVVMDRYYLAMRLILATGKNGQARVDILPANLKRSH